ncbi:MAG: hypothetical protein EF813_09375 [Methanosarcinales archaeon]|nr:MAG: hypothetical protein EF813_09375 [Methanosarcinales archaeon]
MNMNIQIITLIVLLAAMSIMPASAETLEIRGEVVELTTAQAAPISWDAYNFDVFWCDLDDNLISERLTIAAGALTGPNTDRTIGKNCLSYQTIPVYQQYELYENKGLTVNGNTGYYIEGFMGEQYVAINGRADKLCKHLVEFEDDDKKTLSTGEAWDLGGGFALTAGNIPGSCGANELCDSCTLSLSKNGVKLDEQNIYVNTTDDQDRVYTYAPNTGGEERVPVFSCYVDAVFNGTDTDIVQLMHVFLIDSGVLEIDTGDAFGVMEVMTASSSQILLRNNEYAIDLDEGSTEQIMGNIHFKTSDDNRAIRFYPVVGYSKSGTYTIRGNVMDLMSSAQSADIVWDAANFTGFWYGLDDGLKTEQLTVLAGTINSVAGDRTIDKNTLVYSTSPVYHQYELNENEGLVVDSKNPGGDAGYYLEGFMGEKYVAINNRADKLCRLLVEFEDYDTKTLSTGEAWDLGGGFCLIANQINLNGDEAWLLLVKDGKELGNGFVSTNATRQDRVYTCTLNIGEEKWIPVFSCYATAIFRGTDTNAVQIKYVFLIDDDVIEIETQDQYGIMEVMVANATHVRLENEDPLDRGQGRYHV